MLTNDYDVQKLLIKYYPEEKVYADEYQTIHKKLGLIVYNELRLYCRNQGYKSAKEWLIRKDWYVDVERDMRSAKNEMDLTMPIDIIVSRVFESCALLGSAVLLPEQEMQLMESAQKVFDKLLHGQYRTTDHEQDVLTLAVIQRLKRWKSKEENDTSFWLYVYSQFGFKNEDGDSSFTQHLYAAMCETVKSSLTRHQRYFAPAKTTQRYYTSLMIHALAPIESMENLFEILLYFFANDLHYDYMPGDVAFAAFVNAIAGRWDKELEQDEDVKARSLTLTSGLRVLFQGRKIYMRQLCEQIVCKIDHLLNGRREKLNEHSYLDALLMAWMDKRGAEIHEAMNRRRSERSQPVVDATAIRMAFAYEKGQIFLKIPSIRLEEKAEEYPYLCVYQRDQEVGRITLDVYGRLMWTVRAENVPLNRLGIDPDALQTLRIEIHHNHDIIYRSEEKLQREYLVFDRNGNEISRQRITTGEYYLFAGSQAEIELSEDAACYQMPHEGLLYEIQLDDQSWVRVNGQELCVPTARKKTFRHHTSAQKVQGVWAVLGGIQYTIYQQPVRMRFDLPENTKSIGYHIGVNGKWESLSSICRNDQTFFEINLPSDIGSAHCVQFKDILQQRIVYEYRYMILPDFACRIESLLCVDDGKPVGVEITAQGTVYTMNVYPEDCGDEVTVSLDGKEYELRLRIPLVRCSVGSDNAFTLPRNIWHENISKDTFVQISCPQNWRAVLLLGVHGIPETAGKAGIFELGNYLSGYRAAQANERMGIILHGPEQQVVQVPLTDILFEESFSSSPLRMDENRLLWEPAGKYTGAAGTEFRLEIDISDEETFFYALEERNEVVEKNFPYRLGEFSCRVYLQKKSVFAKKPKLLWQERLIVGDPNEWRFDGRYIQLKQARCWNMDGDQYEQIALSDHSLILTDFRYCGMSCPNGEAEDMPEYEAWLSFYDWRDQKWRYFNSAEDSEDYEWVNPVHIWLVNDAMMVLLSASGDAVYVDKRYAGIVNKRMMLSHEEERMRLCNPDYLIYGTEEYNDA